MPNIVDLNANTLRRIIQEERQKLTLEAKKQKVGKVVPPEPKVSGKRSTVPAKIHATNKKAKKALSLDETEVRPDELASTLAKKVNHLREMSEMEMRIRDQLRIVMEKKGGLKQDIAKLL